MGSSYSRSYSPNSNANQCRAGSSADRATISRVESTTNYVESVVCNEGDLNENEMKVFDIGEDGKVLLIKQKGEFSALGTKCTHYGAPLVNGALGDGRIRCQWHGACFNIKTGDIEDFPGFDSLPCYQVTVTEKGQVKVRAKISDLKSNKRVKDVGDGSCACDGSVAVVVGGGPAGATCAETLRSEGFRGRVVLVCKEPHLPYDRIKVSKLGAATDIDKLQARDADYYANAKIEVLKGVEVVRVEPSARYVHLSDGSKLQFSMLFLATGSRPRVPDVPGVSLNNIFTVRNFDDSVKILKALGDDKTKEVVVLGLSFIGLEIASTCNERAKSVTVVGKDTAPLGQIFGAEIGERLRKLFEDKGVKFQFQTTISKCNGEKGSISSVELTDGSTLKADVLILGVGTKFYTDFLEGSGIALESSGAVTVDEYLQTSFDNIYAGGDIAYAPVFAANNAKMSIGHIGLSQYHGRVAALNMLKKETPLKTVPYFWTTIFGKSIRYAGCGRPASSLVEGDLGEMKFVIFFFDASDKVIAIASCMKDPVVSQFAELTHQGKVLHRKDLKDDPFAWTKTIH